MLGSILNRLALTVDRKFCLSSIHPAETFPLILAIGIVTQGLIFAAVQGTGLKSLSTTGCEVTAQFMWPGMSSFPLADLR